MVDNGSFEHGEPRIFIQ